MKLNNKIKLIVVLLSCISTYAQKTIKGTVIDKQSNIPIAGVNVIVPNSKANTITDFDGKFEFQIPQNEITIARGKLEQNPEY